MRRADGRAGHGQALVLVGRTGQTQIAQLGAAVGGQQDVLRLHVAVHQAAGMGVGQPPRHLRRNGRRTLRLDPPLALDQRTERLALHVLHGEVVVTVGLADVDARDDVGMTEPAGRPRLALEPPHKTRIAGQTGRQDLQRHHPVHRYLTRLVYRTHPAAPDARQQLVAANDLDLLAAGIAPAGWLGRFAQNAPLQGGPPCPTPQPNLPRHAAVRNDDLIGMTSDWVGTWARAGSCSTRASGLSGGREHRRGRHPQGCPPAAGRAGRPVGKKGAPRLGRPAASTSREPQGSALRRGFPATAPARSPRPRRRARRAKCAGFRGRPRKAPSRWPPRSAARLGGCRRPSFP
jgi:hypothetical protein